MRMKNVFLLFLWLIIITPVLLMMGCGDKDSTSPSSRNLNGTWNVYRTEIDTFEIYDGEYITLHDSDSLKLYAKCGNIYLMYFIIDEQNVEGTLVAQDTITLTGTISNDNILISGTWTATDGNSGTWRAEKISNSTTPISNGSLMLQCNICNDTINLSSDMVCAKKDYDDEILDDIEINSQYNDGWIGIEIETPDLLSSNTTFDIQIDNFELELQGTIVEECFGYEDQGSSSGIVTIDIYNGNRLKGNFDVILHDDSHITGSFDVEFEN